jgi:hypothetical protein
MPIGKKTALDEIIAERIAKMSKKSVAQLYLEASGNLNPKVSQLDSTKNRTRMTFNHIPGRSRADENPRAIAKREKEAEEEAAR